MDREDEIHDVDDDQCQGQRREHPSAIHARFEVLVMKFRSNPKQTAAPSHHPTLPKIARWMLSEKHSQSGDQQEYAEQVENKMKPPHQRDAAQDHDSAHGQSAEDSTHQRAMLSQRRHAKISKNQYENEDVIDTQRIFDEVSGKKIEPGLRSFNVPDKPIKSER